MFDLGGSEKIEEQLQVEGISQEGKISPKEEGVGDEQWVNGKAERPYERRKGR